MLKLLSNELCSPLYIIFNSSLLSGNIPKIWKKSIITPIFKKGEPSNSNNYRPISITCVMCRVLERIISKQLIFYLKSNNLLTKYQYGFISGKSTELQLTYLTLPGRACSAVNNIFSSIHFCPPSLRAVHLIRILYLLLVDR